MVQEIGDAPMACADLPVCSGCGATIIAVTDDAQPWTVIVREPGGQQHVGGVFCLGCMVDLAKKGVTLHPPSETSLKSS